MCVMDELGGWRGSGQDASKSEFVLGSLLVPLMGKERFSHYAYIVSVHFHKEVSHKDMAELMGG